METGQTISKRMKVFAYIRKSTEENQEGESKKQLNSLEYQKAAVEETAIRNNLEIVKIFKDSKTAYKAYVRDDFNKMMDAFDQDGVDGEIKGIICSEHSRLARNFADGGLVLWYLQSGLIERIYTYDKMFTNSADDQMMLAISFAMDKHASDETGFRMRRAWDIRASQGQPPNTRLPGYRYVGEKGKKVWQIVPRVAPLIKEMFQEYATGKYNLQEITDCMFSRGLVSPMTKRKYSKNSVLGLLKNIAYTGVFYHKGEKVHGEYIPIIDSELFYKVQEVLNNKAHTKISVGNDYAYSGGLIRCAVCGGNMSGTVKKGITYYRCLNRIEPCKSEKDKRPSYLREDTIDEKISEVLKKVEISNKEFEKIAGYVNLLFEDEKTKYISNLRKLTIQKKEAEGELGEITRNLLEHRRLAKEKRDDIWKDEENGYLCLIRDSNERVNMLKRSMEIIEEIKNKLPGMMFDFLDAIKTAGSRFYESSPENKRMIVRTLCANLVWDGENIVWKWKEPYHILTNSAEKINWLRE